MSGAPEPSPELSQVARYVDEAAPLLGLAIPAECLDGVARNLAVLFAAILSASHAVPT